MLPFLSSIPQNHCGPRCTFLSHVYLRHRCWWVFLGLIKPHLMRLPNHIAQDLLKIQNNIKRMKLSLPHNRGRRLWGEEMLQVCWEKEKLGSQLCSQCSLLCSALQSHLLSCLSVGSGPKLQFCCRHSCTGPRDVGVLEIYLSISGKKCWIDADIMKRLMRGWGVFLHIFLVTSAENNSPVP